MPTEVSGMIYFQFFSEALAARLKELLYMTHPSHLPQVELVFRSIFVVGRDIVPLYLEWVDAFCEGDRLRMGPSWEWGPSARWDCWVQDLNSQSWPVQCPYLVYIKNLPVKWGTWIPEPESLEPTPSRSLSGGKKDLTHKMRTFHLRWHPLLRGRDFTEGKLPSTYTRKILLVLYGNCE